MLDESGAGLSVGFAIETGGSFDELARLATVMDSTEAKIIRDAKAIEAATAGMVKVGNQPAAITAIAAASTKAARDLAREQRQAEDAGERLSRQMERQATTFGMSRAAAAALRAEQAGLTELADRLRAQEAQLATMHAQAAAAKRAEADAAARLASEHERLVAAVRGSQAAQEADAAAAERLRERTDPLYAAIKRVNAEIAESTRLYHAGATAPAEYARQQEVLTQRLALARQQHNALAGAAGKSSFALRQFAIQTPDIAQGLLTGQKPMTIFIQQGGQLAQIAMMAEGGIKGFLAALAPAAIAAAPFIAAAAAVAGGFALFERSVGKGVDTKAMIDGLGLTRAEMKRLKDTSVGVGDVVKATFQVMAKNVGLNLAGMTKGFGSALDWMTTVSRKALAGLYAGFLGTFKAIGAIVTGVFSGKSLKEIGKDAVAAYTDIYKEADAKLGKFGQAVTDQVRKNKLADLQRQATEIKKDRTPKTDRHAEQLGRENEAIEAQIKNLYRLAAAYGVSGEAALIAEARTKAETDAIKKRGDIELFVNRQVRLAIAERVADAAKAAAATRDQARIQTEVNGMVAAGTIPAERANEIMQERIAELPLLAAIEAAQQRGLTTEAEKATKALQDQRDAQADLRASAKGALFLAQDAAADRRLAELREEAKLVKETEETRARALALFRAQQDADAQFGAGTAYSRDTVAKAMAIYDATVANADAIKAYNEGLSLAADKWDIIAGKVQAAAQGLGEAFGPAGQAIGDLAGIYANFQAQRERAELQHREAIKAAGTDEARIARENQKYALSSAGAQVAAFGDAAAAAKGFFKEGSSGYRALQKAEQTFRAIQFALSVRAMAQDAIETGSSLARSAARTAAHAVEAVVKAISSLPFPANLAAGAATVAALASLGVSVAGAFGGGGNKPAASNTGTGTVLGDPDAKSASIRNAINALKEVDTLMLSSSRDMAASLRSIDSQIGGLATVLVRAGDINASQGIAQGFKPNLIGSILGNIPLIGGFLSSLFGSKTEVVGSGLYGRAQSIGSILSGGFDASTFSDVKKTKKFLGFTTGTSYSTQYGQADAGLEQQFTLILRSFNDAIAAAAGPLGEATDAVQARLNGFVVSIGKIDLKGLTGEQIQDKLEAVFGAAADNMANAAFPGIARFQKVGEGAFETLVRVASTLEQVGSSLDMLGQGAQKLGIDAKLGLADQFDSVRDLTSAAQTYFEAFYTKEEQAAARTAQFTGVFQSLGLTMPATLAAFRHLVEAQDLTTAAGQATYATLLQLAPAFADLQASMAGAKSAADIASERQDLQRQLLELRGDTAALRALDLAKLDASNRALQQEVWAVQDAQKAAEAAQQLRDAWTSVGDTIEEEVKRIRGLNDAGGGSFAALQGRFNAATLAARGGDQDAAKSLPGLSQALLAQAALVATSRQELDRVQAATAASLEATKRAIDAMTLVPAAAASNTATLLAAAAATQTSGAPAAANDDEEARQLREEVAAMRTELRTVLATIAGNTNRTAKKLEDVTGQSGGDAISVIAA